MTAPRDGAFYAALDPMAQRVGAKAEDLLLVWSSETNLQPNLAGNSRTISTLMHYTAVPALMDEATWQKLPAMSPLEQLPYIERYYAPAHKILGRPFKNTFEVYLANAGRSLLRPGADYSPDTPMYVGAEYPDNWPMDNAPAGAKAAQAAGVRIASPRGTYDFARSLVADGTLKGYVSLGDLRNFAARILSSSSSSSTFRTALGYLANVRASLAAGQAPSVDGPLSDANAWRPASYSGGGEGYAPNLDAFPPGAPVDSRVATPAKARAMTPRSAGGGAPHAISVGGLAIGGGIAITIAILLARKS